ncbi:hypothetical protein BXT92_18050 [Klebsiella pneumoniae]|nr:hypothetical protein BXT92_18050 [Klebsiella pneumoniae]
MKNCLLSAAAQLHRPLSWLCFQMYAILLLQLMEHRKQVTRLGIPFRPEHPYETHARLLLYLGQFLRWRPVSGARRSHCAGA